ncbi:hypothetical protein GCM10009754_61270 [Amycolatopsis minnesotensis]|uniref:Uncharacterized protein n=1 Tax=Amycolatopsis minnesotensis TaxID=337894 RepID=A0ABP5DBI2_9PSEU
MSADHIVPFSMNPCTKITGFLPLAKEVAAGVAATAGAANPKVRAVAIANAETRRHMRFMGAFLGSRDAR